MATETSVIPYSSAIFHQALSIDHASREFVTRNGKQFVQDVLSPIVRKHRLEETFGAGLVHRHFDIASEERLVEFNNISSPWVFGPDAYPAGPNSLVYEVAWMLDPTTTQWMPYEYSFTPIRTSKTHVVDIYRPEYKDFLIEYTATIQEAGFQDIIGLRAWPGKGFRGSLEFSQSRANINLMPEEFELPEDGSIGFTETMWFWEHDFASGYCACVCLRGRHGGHIGHTHGMFNPGGDLRGFPLAKP